MLSFLPSELSIYDISMLVSFFSRHFSPNEFLGLLELMGFCKMKFINNVLLKNNDMGYWGLSYSDC